MFCRYCGKEISGNSLICVHCGCQTIANERKSWLVTLLLCIFIGNLGVHRFYTGHTAIGFAQLLTLGGCGIWTFIDFILILLGRYNDADGFPLQK